jgi:predicted transposase/invertase (TIGR01784 family)
MQSTLPQALRERLTYYSCCTYTEQLFAGDNYDELRPAISICVLDEILFPEPTPYHLSFRLRCDQANITFSNALEFHTLELPKFNGSSHNTGGLTPVDEWAFLLKNAPDMESDELAKVFVDAPLREAVGILLMIAKTPDERRQYNERLKAERDERWRRNAAIKEGLQEGLQEGRKEGLEKGQLIGQMKLLQGYLGEAISADEELMDKSLAELTSLRDQLQSRFDSRNK